MAETIIISPSELDMMRQCALRHQIHYGERWTKDITDELHPLAFGTLWHHVMEAHYGAIREIQRAAHVTHGNWRQFDQHGALAVAIQNVNRVLDSTCSNEEARDKLVWMYEGYIEQWGVDSDWQIVAIEHKFEVDLPGPKALDDGTFKFRLKGKIDLIVKENGRLQIIDHKSCKNLPTKLELDLDDQFSLYHWAMREQGYDVFCTMHGAARKEQLKREMTLEERFSRTPLTRGAKELNMVAQEAWMEAFQRYSFLRVAQSVGLDAQRSPAPGMCKWKCGIVEPCIASRKGIDLRDYLRRTGFRIDKTRH